MPVKMCLALPSRTTLRGACERRRQGRPRGVFSEARTAVDGTLVEQVFYQELDRAPAYRVIGLKLADELLERFTTFEAGEHARRECANRICATPTGFGVHPSPTPVASTTCASSMNVGAGCRPSPNGPRRCKSSTVGTRNAPPRATSTCTSWIGICRALRRMKKGRTKRRRGHASRVRVLPRLDARPIRLDAAHSPRARDRRRCCGSSGHCRDRVRHPRRWPSWDRKASTSRAATIPTTPRCQDSLATTTPSSGASP